MRASHEENGRVSLLGCSASSEMTPAGEVVSPPKKQRCGCDLIHLKPAGSTSANYALGLIGLRGRAAEMPCQLERYAHERI